MTSRYYNMTDSTGASGFLPTVTFDGSSGVFTSAHRVNTLSSIGITGFYEADFANAVTTIDLSAFAFDTKVVVATINGVTTINNDAFYGCSALRSITLDTSVNTTTKKYLLTSIGNRALYECTSLRNLYIPDTVKIIPSFMCYGCSSLEVAVMGYGCASRDGADNYVVDGTIGESAFYGCSKMSFFIIPETVASVGNSAFFNNTLLSYVAIIGKPTFGTNVFLGTTMNTSSARYVYDITMTNKTFVPTNATKNEYYEYEFTASSGNTITAANVKTRFDAIGTTPQWIKVKLKGTGTGFVTTIGAAAFRPYEITTAHYSKIIGFSFPSSITTIQYGAFEAYNGDLNTGSLCNMAAHYIPNSVTTTSPDGANNTYTFNLTHDGNVAASQTRQIVFQSGPNKIQLGFNTFRMQSARAIIINDIASTHATATLKGIPNNCFENCFNLQFCNFFQKNAYSTFTLINANAFQSTFMSGFIGSGRHYIYIPKQIQGGPSSNFSYVFLNTTANILFTIYDKYLDGPAGTGIEGLGSNIAGSGSYIKNAYLGAVANGTVHLICNWYDANGLLSGTFKAIEYDHHILFHPSIRTITDRFGWTVSGSDTRLKSIAIHHSATNVVDISSSAFYNCRGLTYVYLNNRVKTIGVNAFRNIPLSNTFDLIDAHPLETLYHATFYTDSGNTSNIKQITIPNSVKYLGSYAFGNTSLGGKQSFTTLSFETGITFWGDNDNTVAAATFTDTNTASARYMAIPAFLCTNCDSLRNVSFLDTVDANGNAIIADGNGALARPDNSLPIPTRLNSQFLNPAIRRIGLQAFRNNHRLQSIRIPDGVTTIDASGFFDAHSLSYLYLPDSLTSIGLDAFDNLGTTNKFGYTGLEVSVRIPQSRIDDVSSNKFSTNNLSTYFVTVPFDNTSTKVVSGVLQRFTTSAVNTYIKYHVVTLSGITGILGGTVDSQRAFDGFTNLKTLTIADTVTSIGPGAAYNCKGLTNVFISPTSTLTSIGSSAFNSCAGLTTIAIPSLVTDISSSAFAACSALTSVSGLSTGTSLVNIGFTAFNGCTSLTDISMNRVKSIGRLAFRNVPLSNTFDLISATSLEAIYYGAFLTNSVNTNLRQITIPSSVKVLGSYVFASSTVGRKPFFTTLSFASGINFWGDYNGTLSNANTTASYDMDNTSSLRHMAIPDGFCQNCNFLTSIANVLNKNPKYIGNGAFATCTALTAVAIPDSVTNIGNSAFSDCSGLTSASISATSNLVTIGPSAFLRCNRITTINIPSLVTDISTSAFSDCSGLTSVSISPTGSLVSIGNNAFFRCTSLTNISMNRVKSIGITAFYNVPLSNTFDLSAATSLEAIYSRAFVTDASGTSNIRQITIPNSVKVLGSFVFDCSQTGLPTGLKSSFTTLSFASGIEFLGDYDNSLSSTSTIAGYGDNNSSNARYMAIPAFFCRNCNFLTSVSFLDTLDSNGNAIIADASSALVRPDNSLPITTRINKQILNPPIRRIGKQAFVINHRLQSIRIPDGVTAIDEEAFYDAYSLTYLYLPDSLTTMGLAAFNYMNTENKFGYTGKQVSVRLPQLFIENVFPNTFANNTGYFNPYENTIRYFTVAFDNTSTKVASGVLQRFTSRAQSADNFFHVVTLSGITGILGGSTPGARAFDGYTSLKTVTIADSVTSIGTSALSGCTGLTNVFISPTSNLTIIDASAFSGCMGLTTINIPSLVTDISTNAFSDCSGLTSVIFSPTGSLVSIGNSAFIRCTSLTNISTNRVKSIGVNAFRNAPLSNTFDLSSATYLEAIYHAAFYTDNGFTASNIRQITMPMSVKYLGSYVFSCHTLGQKASFTTLSFESGIEFWGDYNNSVADATFTDLSSARYMAIPAFFCENCNFLTSVSFLDTVDANGNAIPADGNRALTRPNNSLPIPTRLNSQILNPPIRRIGDRAFAFNYRLQSIRIPDGVTTIDKYAFYDAYSLSYIYLPDSLTTEIGIEAFSFADLSNQFGYTGKEVSVRLPQSRIDDGNTTRFGTYNGSTFHITVPFDNTSAKVSPFVNTSAKVASGVLGRFTSQAANSTILYHVVTLNGITGILGSSSTPGARAFGDYTTLKTVTIADTVTNIGWGAFSGCTGLTNVFISPTSNLTLLENSAFVNCTALTSVFIPNSLKVIETSVFNMSGLRSVTYGDNPGLKYISHAAFYGVKTLPSIFIPSSVVHIGSLAFITNVNADINILNTVTFGAGSRLKSIDIRCFGFDGNGVQRAAQYLRDLVLPSSLRFMGIDDSSMQNTHRLAHSANLVVPSSVEVIPWAFLYADGSTVDISNIYFPRSITNVAGPRVHGGYRTNGSLVGAEFSSSRAGSLIYLPSELSAYTGYSGYAFPGPNRTRSFYKTKSLTDNPLITLGLGLSIVSTANATDTSQIHANIQEGVVVIGNGNDSIAGTGTISPRNLISVNIPSTVTNITANAFSGCTALVYVTFSENSKLSTIGDSAFLGCATIHDIQLPNSLTAIGANAFNGCYNLASISIPYNVTSIGAGAFNIHNNTPTTYINRPAAYLAYQLGQDIYGEAISDYSAFSVSLSQDGKILAIGSQLNDAGGGDAGQVRVYKYQTIADATWANYTVNSFSQNGTAPFNKPIVVNGGDAFPVSGKYYWVQLGNDINGETNYNYAGWSVSLSADGSTVAIGALVNSGAGFHAGQVRVYKYQTVTDANWTNYTVGSFTHTGIAPFNKPIVVNGGDGSPIAGKFYWVQLGADIDGETINSQSGNSVSLSSNGQILAIGARLDDLNSRADSGSVRVYQYSSGTGTWSKLGSTITGGALADDRFGESVSLSDNGTVLAIGAIYADSNSDDAGTVRVYEYSSNTWTQRGSDIIGEARWDQSGFSVSLSSDGTIVAIGAIGNGDSDSGHVRVYKWNGTAWNKLGQDIDGIGANDHFGNSVSLSSDGTILAVGSRYSDTGSISNTGLARIYKFFNGAWQQLGQDIRGDFANDQSGWSVSLSKDGTTVAVGANGNDSNGQDSGSVRVYQINQFTVPIRLHQRLYNDISGSLSTYFPGIYTGAVQVIPELQLTNTLNPSNLTISQINNLYIRYRQSQLGFCIRVTVSASSGGTLSASDVTNALSGTTGMVHLDFGPNVTSIADYACTNNTRIYSVAISKTVTAIGKDAFYGCTNLTYLSFHPDSVCTSIGQGAFLGNNIIDLALPDSLTAISSWSFQNSNRLTSVCIPKNVTSLGLAFVACPKLTSVALPSQLSTANTSSYFSTNVTGSVVTGFTIYDTAAAIPHFKLSEYSMPSGMVQTVIDSAVTYIDHRAYVYYPDITLYAVTTNKQTQTAGQYNYVMNGIKMPFQPAAFLLNGAGFGYNSMFPLYRSIPDLNVYSLSDVSLNWIQNSDDYYILMPGYSMCIYNNLYDEENLFPASPTERYYDNEFGKVPLNINVAGLNTTTSILIMYKGRILSKYFST